jgi:hypothetical protein
MWNDAGNVATQDDLLSRLPDVILPSQFFESIGAQPFSSEQRLMLAVLIDAINVLGDCGDSPNRRKSNQFNEASSWIFADRSITSPLSFDHVCDALSVDAESLRRRLSKLLSECSGRLLRLRLKGGGRMQCVTVNRAHRRVRRAHQDRRGVTLAKIFQALPQSGRSIPD